MSQLDIFLQWLTCEHERIMDCEHLGIELLNRGDSDAYRQKMREKAEMLANLANAAKPHLTGLAPDMAKKISEALQKFSDSAAISIQINSVFYMSALLYRDDHKPGEPDNLEIYIRSLKENFAGGENG